MKVMKINLNVDDDCRVYGVPVFSSFFGGGGG